MTTPATPSLSWKDKAFAYIQLTRFDKPVGIELLLWPTLWGIFLAGLNTPNGLPHWQIVLIFATGATLMRAAGCAINDFADRKFDGFVKRTSGRPLADGRLQGYQAVWTFLILSWMSASLLLFLPKAVFFWSLGAVALAFIYPFMKRFTHLPQVFLAAAFGWSIPMGYVAVQGQVDIWSWALFFAYMCWTVAYDTQYAMADRTEDLKIGIKSTAILFGRHDLLIIALLQSTFLGVMGLILWHYFVQTSIAWLPIFALAPVAILFSKQNRLCATRDPQACFQAFLANVWVGRYLFTLIVLCCLALQF